MSWVPAMLGTGYSGIPLLDVTTGGVYIGIGEDEGYYKYKLSNGKHIIADNIFPFTISLDEDFDYGWPSLSWLNLFRGYLVKEKFCFYYSETAVCYCTGGNTFTLIAWAGRCFGKSPVTWTDSEGKKRGDYFWSGEFPTKFDTTVTWTGGGAATDTTIEIYVKINTGNTIYVSDTEYGVYTNSKGAKKVFGHCIWNGMNSSSSYVKSLTKKQNEKPVFINTNDESLNIHHDGTGWIVGVRNSADGWWELESEPVAESEIKLIFKKTDDSTVTGTDYTLAWKNYGYYLESNKFYVGEVGLWK